MSVLTITGDRQTGKSYTLALLALDAALAGKSVFFACAGRTLATERFYEMLARCELFGLYEKAWRAKGEQRIKLRNGSMIWFGTPADRGHQTQVRILDDVPDHPDLYFGAERVIRSELS